MEVVMKRALFSIMALACLLTLPRPAAEEDLASSIVGVWKYTGIANKQVATGKVTHPYGEKPSSHIASGRGVVAVQSAIAGRPTRDLLEGLARQIDEINRNMANLGPNNAAATRFLAASLTAYQRAWAELTWGQVDFDGGAAGHEPADGAVGHRTRRRDSGSWRHAAAAGIEGER